MELWIALSLLLVVEGIFPAAAPRMFRRVLFSMLQMDERALRLSGFISMGLGAILLYLLTH